MNFTPDMLDLVLSGKKTQTRRPWKLGETRSSEIDGDDYGMQETIIAVHDKHGRAKWRIGQSYAVCPGRGKSAVARIKLRSIRCEPAYYITEEDARAEGFDSREAFWDKLRSLYGANVDLTAPYWALTFELVKEVQP